MITSKRKFEKLQKKYPRFIFEKYDYRISDKNLEIFFDFKIENIHFKPKIVIKDIDKHISKKQLELLENGELDNFIFHLGLMEIPTYWKCVCSPIIEIKAGCLNKEQTKWWKDFIINGMGQFFYENQIDFRSKIF